MKQLLGIFMGHGLPNFFAQSQKFISAGMKLFIFSNHLPEIIGGYKRNLLTAFGQMALSLVFTVVIILLDALVPVCPSPIKCLQDYLDRLNIVSIAK